MEKGEKMKEESMILRDLPVNTRNYTILDNVTGKPIDQGSYSLTIDKEVISKLNKLKQVNEEKKRQASLKGQYSDIALVDTFTPKDTAVFTPLYSGEYIDAQDFIEKEEKVEEVQETVQEETTITEIIKQDTLLERVVARDPRTVVHNEEGEENSEPTDEQTQPQVDSFQDVPSTPAPQIEKTGLQQASEQIVNIDADKLGREIKAPTGFKEGKEVITLDKMEIREGKGIAWLAYILFFIPLLMNKTNRYVRLHANVGLELNILELLSVILIAPKLLLTSVTGTLSIILTVLSLVGLVLLASCAITLIPMIIGAMFGKPYQRPWLFRKRFIKVSTERP